MGTNQRNPKSLIPVALRALAIAIVLVLGLSGQTQARTRHRGTSRRTARVVHRSRANNHRGRQPASSSRARARSSHSTRSQRGRFQRFRRGRTSFPNRGTRARVALNPSRRPASVFSGSVEDSNKPLQVRGQTRNLSMMLVLKGEKDKITFGKVRDNYHSEVLNTDY